MARKAGKATKTAKTGTLLEPTGPAVERAAGRDQCGHVVTGRPDLCPCRRLVDHPAGGISGDDETLTARARTLGVDPGAYIAGVRAAERNT